MIIHQTEQQTQYANFQKIMNKTLLIFSILLLSIFIFPQCSKDNDKVEITPEDNDDGINDDDDTDDDDDEIITCDLTYEQALGNSWHNVGQDQYVNTYRGLYWVGETKTICSVDMNLNYTGDISSINYNVTV